MNLSQKQSATCPQTISVIGLGRLGAPFAVCLASKGYGVIAVDVDADPNRRLLNALAHRRAEWLLKRADELILTVEKDDGGGVG